jgi:hypothetical protein
MSDEKFTDAEIAKMRADEFALVTALPDGATIRLKDLPSWPLLRASLRESVAKQIERMRSEGDMSFLEPGWDPMPPTTTRF